MILMGSVTLGGNPVSTSGSMPLVGTDAPDFRLSGADLGEITAETFAGQKLVLNIFPSVDTPTCAMSVRTFNERAAQLPNTTVLCVSADLPFAAGRFCGAEGIDNVVTGSTFRNGADGPNFGADYGLELIDGKLAGLLARAVVVVDETGTILHTELVSEIADEPDYDAAIDALS